MTSRRDAASAPGRALAGLDQGDLGADERAVGDVVVPQGGRCRVAGVLAVLGEEERRGLRGAELFQVHGEEGGVVQAVDVAQAVVELQAVQDARAVVEAEDVLGEQVAVAVDHPPLLDAGVEQPLAAGEIAAHQPLDLRHAVGHGAVVGQRADLREAGFPARRQRVPGALLVHVPAAGRVRVTGGELPGDGPQDVVDDDARRLPAGRGGGPPACGASRRGVRAPSASGLRNSPSAQVDVGGEATVESDFPLARGPPSRHGGVVQEPQVDRLLELVGAVADEEHDRGVGLAHLRARERRPSMPVPGRSADASA